MSQSLLRLIRKKQRLWQALQKNKSEMKHLEYKAHALAVKRETKAAKEEFEKSLTQSENKKMFYAYMSSKTKGREGIGNLKTPSGGTASNNVERCQVLNNFFSSVYSELPPAPHDPGKQSSEKLSEVLVHPGVVAQHIMNLKKNSSPGPDGISPQILQRYVNILAYPLAILFNKTMKDGKVPNDWKLANDTPIYKKGQRD